MSDTRRVITTCTRDCPNTCGLIATVEAGRLTKLTGNPDHPLTRGKTCVKASRYIQRVYSKERITHPLVRQNGQWVRTSWRTALARIAERITSIIEASGPEAILYYQGYGERTALKLLNKYFFNLLGGVTTLRGSLCGGTGQASQNLDLGDRISHDPLDHENSASMVLWARNPVSTNISLVPIITGIKKRGGRIILVDPVRTRSAELADRHIRPRPGRDVYLAMAAAKCILDAGMADRGSMEDHAEGAAAYEAFLARFDVAELADMAGVTREDVDYLAETLMTQKPTSILLGWGLHRHTFAHHSIRAIDALGAVSGNLGVPGGGVSQGFEEYGPYDPTCWGDDLNPPRRTLLMPTIGQEILNARDPEIRMIFVTAANPVCMAPNTEKVVSAFRKAEFVVYSGHFMDDTADLADVFLPATTFLEEQDVMASYGHNYVGPVNRAIAPVGECKSEFQMFFELAAHFPFAAKYRRSVDQWLQDLCAPIWEQGGTLDSLKQEAFRMDAPMVPYADRVFPTPSGRFRFMGAFDTADIHEPDPDYPYRLISAAPHDYICSERTLTSHPPLPVVRLHPDEADQCGVADGDHVAVVSAVGSITAMLRTDPGVRRNVVATERGGWDKAGHGINRLCMDMASRVGQGTPYYETGVNVLPLADNGIRGKTVLVVQNSDHAPGGVLCRELIRQGVTLETCRPFDGQNLPSTPDGYAGIVVLGGPQNAFDDEGAPYFVPLMALMRAFDRDQKPVAGVCLGAQLLSRAHGGAPWSCGGLEFGFVEHSVTEAGRTDPVVGGSLPLPGLMEFHQDSFQLPERATLLVEGDFCPNQCFSVGNCSYGFQFHLEVDAITAGGWIEAFENGEIEAYRRYRKDYEDALFETLLSEMPLRIEASEKYCRRVVRNWLGFLPGNDA